MIAALPSLLVLAASLPAAQVETPPELVWLDVDADGRVDLVALAPDRGPRLLRNLGPDGFADETARWGLDGLPAARKVLACDADGDADLDLVLAGPDGLRLLRQQGGTFVDATVASGLDGVRDVASASCVDANGDGRDDLHVVAAGRDRVFVGLASGAFEELALGLPPVAATVVGTSPSTPLAGTPAADVPPGASGRGPAAADVPRELGAGRGGLVPGPGGSGTLGVTVTGPAISGTTLGPLPPSLNGMQCVESMEDQGGGSCVQASSVPTLGMLYPLGPELFIDSATGNVGVGTLAPGYALEVAGKVVSGSSNTSSGLDSAIGGGSFNIASGDRATVAGGVGNSAGYRGAIGGGDNNRATGNLATVSGGKLNDALQGGTTVGGGENNVADATHATIAGGLGNSATGASSSVGGGSSNLVTGAYGAIPGGRENVAAGAYAQAGGRRAKAVHDGAFVWADATDADFSSTAPDQFVVRASGGVGIGKAPDPSIQVDVEGVVRASDTIVSTKAAGAPLQVASTDLVANLNADRLDGFDAAAFSTFGSQVDTGELADEAVTAAKIQDFSIGSDDLAGGAVTSSKIAIGAVGPFQLADQSVTTSKIFPSSINASLLQANAVVSDKIQDGAVNLPKIDPAGGLAGQILTHDGSAVVWGSVPDASWTPITSLPFTASTPGPYYLAGDLTGVAGAAGIEVTADDVVIDLNGHVLTGVPGALAGVLASASRVTVRNGSVRSWPSGGVVLGPDGVATHLITSGNSLGGIVGGAQRVRIAHCSSWGDDQYGFFAASGTIESSTATGALTGFSLYALVEGSLVRDCVARQCSAVGVSVYSGTVVDCVVTETTGNGFELYSGRVVSCYAKDNTENGFLVLDGTRVRDCLSSGNARGFEVFGDGNRLEGNSSYECSIRGFGVSGTDNLLIRNSDQGSTTPFSIATGNKAAAVLTPSDGFSSSNAWANIAH